MTTADRELLDLAAKAMIAAGQPLLWAKDHDEPEPYWMLDFEPWRPREDDGAALRMAAELRLDILQDERTISIKRWSQPTLEFFDLSSVQAAGGRAAAIREAIFLAAAEIGRALP